MLRGLRALLILSLAAVVCLMVAQAASLLDFYLAPAPAPGSTGPSGTVDATLGAVAGLAGVIGLNLAAAAGLVGFILAIQAHQRGWAVAIAIVGVATTGALIGAAWVLLSSPSNPFDPMIPTLSVPITTGLFAWRAGSSGSRVSSPAGSS